MPGFPDHHQLWEFAQTHAHWVGDAIQPSHPLSSPSPHALSLRENICFPSPQRKGFYNHSSFPRGVSFVILGHISILGVSLVQLIWGVLTDSATFMMSHPPAVQTCSWLWDPETLKGTWCWTVFSSFIKNSETSFNRKCDIPVKCTLLLFLLDLKSFSSVSSSPPLLPLTVLCPFPASGHWPVLLDRESDSLHFPGPGTLDLVRPHFLN